MFDAPADTWYLWLGIATASLVAFGVAVSLPTAPPPDATDLAATVDSVATSPHNATAQHPLAADEIRLGPHRVGLRDDGGAAHATFAYGPVTPVGNSSQLSRVLEGVPPAAVFDTRSAFRNATATARNGSHEWHHTDDRLLVRRVTWGEFDVTLVGA